ncbi:hypothetical protein QQ045_030507 [Rhodiola kirilowii]
MSNPKNSFHRSPFPLPPGCRFFPTEQQLLRYYLPGKNSLLNDSYDASLISEFDVLGHDPVELVGIEGFEFGVGGRRMHWYCYAPRVDRKRRRRRTRGGYWKRKGMVRDIMGEDGVVIGRRSDYLFYLKGGFGAKCGVLTDWVVYEYALIEEEKNMCKDFVLFRAFEKPRERKDALHAHFEVSDDSYLNDSSELASVLKQGDFIELDDLLTPLSSMDNAGS